MMTAEREAMTLESIRDDIRNGMYDAMHPGLGTLAAWADAIDAHLSRAAEPVYQVTGLAGGDWTDCDRATYDEAATWPLGEDRRRILYSRPPEPARDAKNWYLRGDTLHFDISDDPNNQLSIMVRRDGLISYAIYFGPSDRHYGVPSGNEFLTALAQWMDSAAMAQESGE